VAGEQERHAGADELVEVERLRGRRHQQADQIGAGVAPAPRDQRLEIGLKLRHARFRPGGSATLEPARPDEGHDIGGPRGEPSLILGRHPEKLGDDHRR
jgi:hypothetical protein